MEQRLYYGDIKPDDLARALFARFSRGNLRAQQVGSGDQMFVQITSQSNARSGGPTALTVTIQRVPDGISVQIGKQDWFGVAASLGMTALQAMRNPFSLIGRLDDVAQDLENLQITQQVWEAIDQAARAKNASQELATRLRRLICDYCDTPNKIEDNSCIACGAPLGSAQPRTCLNCGFIVTRSEGICPNCRKPL